MAVAFLTLQTWGVIHLAVQTGWGAWDPGLGLQTVFWIQRLGLGWSGPAWVLRAACTLGWPYVPHAACIGLGPVRVQATCCTWRSCHKLLKNLSLAMFLCSLSFEMVPLVISSLGAVCLLWSLLSLHFWWVKWVFGKHFKRIIFTCSVSKVKL